jgi:peptide/nickel transport system substrate-binding protein
MGIRRLVLFLMVTVLTFGALFGSAPANAQGQPNIITITFTQEPDSLNPLYTTQYFSGLARSLILKGAWDYDDNLNLVPVLASEIPSLENGGVSEDGTTITIRLRDDAQWSDGTPITSADFLFTAEMYASEQNAPIGRGIFDPTEGVIADITAPDAQTVVVTFNEPFAGWPSNLFGAVLPEHILRPVFEEAGTLDGAEWNTRPTVVSGPFTLAEYEAGQFMRFERNENYVLGAPQLEQILIRFVADEAAQLAAAKALETDVTVFLAPTEADELTATGSFDIYTLPAGYTEGWFFNLNPDGGHPALQDVNVRRAISLAVNREELTVGLLNGLVQPAISFWDSTPFQDPTLEAPVYDPEAAAALLDEAGWVDGNGDGVREKDGTDLRLRYATNSRQLRKDAQLIIEAQLAQVGIAVEIINYPNQGFLSSYADEGPIARGGFDIAQWSTGPRFPDPDTSRFITSEINSEENGYVGANWFYISDPELDTLFDQQRSTVDAQARTEIFHQISRIVIDNVYWMPLWQDPDIWGVNKRVQGIRFSGGSPWWNVHEWTAQ